MPTTRNPHSLPRTPETPETPERATANNERDKPRHRKPRCHTHPPFPQPLERGLLRWGDVEGVVDFLRPVRRRGAGLLVPVVVEMPGRRWRRRPALLHFSCTYEIRKGDDTEVSSRSLTLAPGGRSKPQNTQPIATARATRRAPKNENPKGVMETRRWRRRSANLGGWEEETKRSCGEATDPLPRLLRREISGKFLSIILFPGKMHRPWARLCVDDCRLNARTVRNFGEVSLRYSFYLRVSGA